MQELVFEADGRVSFKLDGQPVLGMGEGGPRPERGRPWREQPVQFDRRGALDTMEPRWQSDMYGSRNPVAMLLGTGGWGLFVAAPWVHVDLRDASRGVFLPWTPTGAEVAPQTERNQQQNAGKGLPPIDAIVPGLFDLFVFDAQRSREDPRRVRRDHRPGGAAAAVGARLHAVAPHARETTGRCSGSIDTFRSKRIPLDAVIYLGTGFAPRGWNTRQPSFEFNPEVFTRDPAAVLADMHARHVKVVVHMVPWDRDKLPTLHGSIPAAPGETIDDSHIQSYWQQHVPLVSAGVDAFWPDEGDWFNLHERIKRHQLYYQGSLSTRPERPAVESAAQRLPGHRAVGRLGVVGRYRQRLEDARGADRGRDQLLAQHRSVLGIRHRRLLSEQRADRRALRALAPVRGLLRVVPIARPDLVHCGCPGAGARPTWDRASTATPTRRSRPTTAATSSSRS